MKPGAIVPGFFLNPARNMTLSDQIYIWLEADGPYTQGVALFRQTGGYKPVGYYERYYHLPYLPSNIKDKLKRDLQKYININPPTRAIDPPTTASQTAEAPEEPEAIIALRQKAIPLHKRYSHLKGELYTLDQQGAAPKEIYGVCHEIMSETIPALDNIYDQIREWQRTGEVPEMPRPVLVEHTVRKMKRVNSLRSGIANIKAKLRKGNLPEAESIAYEQDMAKKEAEIAELEAELGLNQ